MAVDFALEALIRRLPKVELHIHIEGSLEPEMAFSFASRNGVTLPYMDVSALRAAYSFVDLQSFLDVYYAGCAVLKTERDFHEMTVAYLQRAAADHVVHAELFFDPQTHSARGVPFETMLRGIRRGLDEGWRVHEISSGLILCFLRHLGEDEALATLEEALPFRAELLGVGLDSSEVGHPPSKFARVFAQARDAGLRTVAHAGEEGPASYVREALELLQVERIDHGVRCEEDPALVEELARRRVPLTMCPLSNVKLGVVDSMAQHNVKRLLHRGLCVTINSDDPAYFGGYLNDNLLAICDALQLSAADVIELVRNSVLASFLPESRKRELLAEVASATPDQVEELR